MCQQSILGSKLEGIEFSGNRPQNYPNHVAVTTLENNSWNVCHPTRRSCKQVTYYFEKKIEKKTVAPKYDTFRPPATQIIESV